MSSMISLSLSNGIRAGSNSDSYASDFSYGSIEFWQNLLAEINAHIEKYQKRVTTIEQKQTEIDQKLPDETSDQNQKWKDQIHGWKESSHERLQVLQKMVRFDRMEMMKAHITKGKLAETKKVKDPGKFPHIISPPECADGILPFSPSISSNTHTASSFGLKCEDESLGLTRCHRKTMEFNSEQMVFDIMTDKNVDMEFKDRLLDRRFDKARVIVNQVEECYEIAAAYDGDGKTEKLEVHIAYRRKIKKLMKGEIADEASATTESDIVPEGYDARVNLKGINENKKCSFTSKKTCRTEVCDVENLGVFKETVEPMFEDSNDIKKFMRMGVYRAISSCRKYLEVVPWTDDEDEKLKRLLAIYTIDDVATSKFIARLNSNETENLQDIISEKLVWSIASNSDANPRNELKSLVKGFNYKSSVYEKEQLGIKKEDIYKAGKHCVDSVTKLFEEGISTSISISKKRKPLIEGISREVENINWLLDIMIDREIAKEFVEIWGSQRKLAEMHRVAVKLGLETDASVGNSLDVMYCDCGHVKDSFCKYQLQEQGETRMQHFLLDCSLFQPLFNLLEDVLNLARVNQLVDHDDACKAVLMEDHMARKIVEKVADVKFWNEAEAVYSLLKLVKEMARRIEEDKQWVGQCLPLWTELRAKEKDWSTKFNVVEKSLVEKLVERKFKKSYHLAWAAVLILDPFLLRDSSGKYLPPFKCLSTEQEKDVYKLITRLVYRDEAHSAMKELMKWRTGLDPIYVRAVQMKETDPISGKMKIADPQSSRLVWGTYLNEFRSWGELQ